ncbi:methionyl-tRNA formyltransferase [Candidatus Spongiihabitans sp.]|uniref:methionyl-tRNA formyltransferase n=1 Tax=Candidatus Spongiihabitans sp. TaxID=3101308 RepID=UPI003C702857
MRVVFAGTPEFSVPSLEALINTPFVEVVGVYTQPDRPAGRGKKRHKSAVKSCAEKQGLTVYQPESVKGPAVIEHLGALNADLMLVTAYGLLLPTAVLEIPRLGCVNVHASLLPRWRGAAPIQRAIEAGDRTTGITLIQMQLALDSGPILAQSQIDISESETGGTLHDKLSALSGELLENKLSKICDQSLEPVVQDNALATYANKLSKAESKLDWGQSAKNLQQKVRAFNPWPMTTTKLGEMTIRIIKASHINSQIKGKIGQVLSADNGGVVVQTGQGQLNVEVLQKPGGKALAVADFLNGMSITKGMVFR